MLPWVLAGVLTVSVLAAAWWQSHPTAFLAYGGGGSGGSARVGTQVNVDSGIYTHDHVTLLSVRPRVAPGSPDADFDVTVCGPPRSSGVGVVFGDLNPYCGTALPVEDAVLLWPQTQVVVTIWPA